FEIGLAALPDFGGVGDHVADTAEAAAIFAERAQPEKQLGGARVVEHGWKVAGACLVLVGDGEVSERGRISGQAQPHYALLGEAARGIALRRDRLMNRIAGGVELAG